jgi:quinolinate synthase
MLAGHDLAGATAALEDALSAHPAPLVLVASEVGLVHRFHETTPITRFHRSCRSRCEQQVRR